MYFKFCNAHNFACSMKLKLNFGKKGAWQKQIIGGGKKRRYEARDKYQTEFDFVKHGHFVF